MGITVAEPNNEPYYDKEAVFDEQIAPLLQRMGVILREHQMPFLVVIEHTCEHGTGGQDGHGFATAGLRPQGRVVAPPLEQMMREVHASLIEPDIGNEMTRAVINGQLGDPTAAATALRLAKRQGKPQHITMQVSMDPKDMN